MTRLHPAPPSVLTNRTCAAGGKSQKALSPCFFAVCSHPRRTGRPFFPGKALPPVSFSLPHLFLRLLDGCLFFLRLHFLLRVFFCGLLQRLTDLLQRPLCRLEPVFPLFGAHGQIGLAAGRKEDFPPVGGGKRHHGLHGQAAGVHNEVAARARLSPQCPSARHGCAPGRSCTG